MNPASQTRPSVRNEDAGRDQVPAHTAAGYYPGVTRLMEDRMIEKMSAPKRKPKLPEAGARKETKRMRVARMKREQIMGVMRGRPGMLLREISDLLPDMAKQTVSYQLYRLVGGGEVCARKSNGDGKFYSMAEDVV